MNGAEYLTASVLDRSGRPSTWRFGWTCRSKGIGSGLPQRLNPAWNLVGRVHFNLAENRKDEEAPFAFLATYTHAPVGARQSPAPAARRRPCASTQARRARTRLLSLLLPVQRAAERCAWLQGHGRRAARSSTRCAGRPQEAFQLAAATCPSSSAPAWSCACRRTWRAGRPSRPQVTRTVGGEAPSGLGTGRAARLPDGGHARRRAADAAEIRDAARRLRWARTLRGRWVEVDREQLARHARASSARSSAPRPSRRPRRSPRRCACSPGADVGGRRRRRRRWIADWSRVVAGPWLAETLRALRSPEGLARVEPGPRAARHAAAVSGGRRALAAPAVARSASAPAWPTTWASARRSRCWRCCSCCAERTRRRGGRACWSRRRRCWPTGTPEIARFAPSLRDAGRASVGDAGRRAQVAGRRRARRRRPRHHELRVAAARAVARRDRDWDLVVLDEAQAIKNPGAQADAGGQEARGRAHASP